MKAILWIICIVAGTALLGLTLNGLGLMVVYDSTGQVSAAAVTNDIEAQPLYSMPGGLFVGFPNLEGVVEIRCRDFSEGRQWYVTRSFPTWVTVAGPHPCRFPT